jgi:predicted dehydrogenase
LVEKPLGSDLADATAFVDRARAQNVLVQVNVPRRADPLTRSLASGALAGYIGPVQAASAIYGNGLVNNGTHLVDLVRMLLGEVTAVQAYPQTRFVEGPLKDDVNVPFVVEPAGGVPVLCSPVRFSHYREVALDLWGERARLVYAHGGLEVRIHRIVPGKAPAGTFEVEIVASEALGSTLGESFYAIYDNLAATLDGRSTLVSPAESALRTAAVIQAIRESCARDGARIPTP